jgi:hypothetical protein
MVVVPYCFIISATLAFSSLCLCTISYRQKVVFSAAEIMYTNSTPIFQVTQHKLFLVVVVYWSIDTFNLLLFLRRAELAMLLLFDAYRQIYFYSFQASICTTTEDLKIAALADLNG